MNELPIEADVSWEIARKIVGSDGRLSVIMPAFNLGSRIKTNIEEVARTFRGRIPFEIVVVSDGSHDDTWPEIEKAREGCPELIPVNMTENHGKGHALRQGFARSSGTHILFLDADLDLPAYQAAWFFEEMDRSGADIVIGAKRHPRSELVYPLKRRIISGGYYMLVRLLFGLPVRDTQTGIKLFKRAALEKAMPRMLVKRFAFDLELLVIARHLGYKISEAPVVLNFTGPYGCVTKSTIKQIMNDTLAIFYRLRILRYYQSIAAKIAPHKDTKISVVIACPQVSTYLDKCMQGLDQQTYRNFEVLILPDTPTGRRWPPYVRELPTGKRRPAEKRNTGIREAAGEIVAFIDDDARPDATWIEEAVGYFGDESIGAVGGPGVTPQSEPFWAACSGLVLANPLVSGHYRYRYTPTKVLDTDDLPSCNLIVRRELLLALGCFRTDFWPGEDTILCLDIIKTGKKIIYDPRILVSHHRRALFLPHLRQIARYARHRGHFVRRFPQTSLRLAYMLPSLFLIGLIAGIPVSFASVILRNIYLSICGIYLLLTGVFSFPLENFLSNGRLTIGKWFACWSGVAVTHLVYGYQFLAGIIARRMPCEAQAFDHPSEAAS